MTEGLHNASSDGVHYNVPSPWTGVYYNIARDLVEQLNLPCGARKAVISKHAIKDAMMYLARSARH